MRIRIADANKWAHVPVTLGAACLLLFTGTARSSTFTVTTTADSGPGSLRQAVLDANANPGADTVAFDTAVFSTPQTIALSTGQLEVSDTTGALTINGPSAGVTVSGSGLSRVITVDVGVGVSVSRLTITQGNDPNAGGIYNQGTLTVTNGAVLNGDIITGRGIYNAGGTLTLVDSTVSQNSREADGGGGIYNAAGTVTLINSIVSENHGRPGAIYNVGTLSVTGCTISGNAGGGIVNNGGTVVVSDSLVSENASMECGGICNRSGIVTVNNSTISANSSDGGGGVNNEGTLTLNSSTVSENSSYGGGSGILNHGTLTLNGSTVSQNRVGRGGAGGSGGGGGIWNVTGTLTLINSTVAGNSAGDLGGGIWNANANLTLINSTVSGNSAGDLGGGGIYNSTTLNLKNSIIAGNTASGLGPDIFSSQDLTSNGANFIGSTDGIHNAASLTDKTFLSTGTTLAQLLQTSSGAPLLANNGGPTATIALVPGSPAIDSGNNADGAGLLYDQRGPGFPRIVDGQIDIGAFELNGVDLIGDLIVQISDLPPIQSAIYHALLAKLQSALTALSVNDTASACAAIQDFINQTQAQSGKKIPTSTATMLINDATQIQAFLGYPTS